METFLPPKEQFVRRVFQLGQAVGARRVIEFGCGQGHEAALLKERSSWEVLATDASEQTLISCGPGLWTRVIDVSLPLPLDLERGFQLGYCAFLLHLLTLKGKKQFFANCARCIEPGGMFVCLTASEDDLRRRFIAQYFPSAFKIDVARYLTIGDIEELLRSAGFIEVRQEPILLAVVSLEDRLAFCRDRLSSILRVIPEAEYREGFERMKLDVNGGGRKAASEVRQWWRTLIIGTR